MKQVSRTRKKPETLLQTEIMNFLKIRDWGVMNIHGNMYQSGLPDLYAYHLRYGTRWIEIKRPSSAGSAQFTPAQIELFPNFAAKGVGIWVLVAATEEEYKKLFGKPNWHTYLPIFK